MKENTCLQEVLLGNSRSFSNVDITLYRNSKLHLSRLPVKDDSEWSSMVNICDLMIAEITDATHYDSSGLARNI